MIRRRAVAYVRKSGGGDPTGTYDDQRSRVLELAHAHGDTLADPGPDRKAAQQHPDWFVDWRVSGGNTRVGRPAYEALLTEAEAGNIASVYAFDEERLSRDVEFGVQLLKSAEAHGFRVITPSGIISDPDQRTMCEIRWVFAGDYRRKVSERARRREARKRAHDEPSGRPRYGHAFKKVEVDGSPVWREVVVDQPAIDHVIAVYEGAGRSGNAAAQRLNAEGVPAPRSGLWRSEAVYRVVRYHRPDLINPRRGRKRRTPTKPTPFGGLLQCPCGSIMSPNGRAWTCPTALSDGSHPRPYSVNDSIVREWAIKESGRLVVPDEMRQVTIDGEDVEARREAVRRRRRRSALLWQDDEISDDDWQRVKAETDAELAELDAVDVEITVNVPGEIDWTLSPASLSRVLSALWHRIELEHVDGRLRPARADWRIPEWRSKD